VAINRASSEMSFPLPLLPSGCFAPGHRSASRPPPSPAPLRSPGARSARSARSAGVGHRTPLGSSHTSGDVADASSASSTESGDDGHTGYGAPRTPSPTTFRSPGLSHHRHPSASPRRRRTSPRRWLPPQAASPPSPSTPSASSSAPSSGSASPALDSPLPYAPPFPGATTTMPFAVAHRNSHSHSRGSGRRRAGDVGAAADADGAVSMDAWGAQPETAWLAVSRPG